MTDLLDTAPRVWRVEALCHALADTLNARFNPVRVVGELSGFSRAVSGHCYFTLKDSNAQLRCAMFKRAAGSLDFTPRDGERVEVQGRLDVYGPRGDLQLIVEGMQRQGQGSLFEAFLQCKARLQAQGLFDPERKRAVPALPRGIGLVTSLGAAALHDVATSLRRRVPHIPVVLAPAAVQGEAAPAELVRALRSLFAHASSSTQPPLDVIVLVRGGGSLEDLWAFNDEQLAHTISQSPVPVVCGVGHETDFTIADFVADVRAPTPTAAAELVATPTVVCAAATDSLAQRMADAVQRVLDQQTQRLDRVAARAGRPSGLVAGHALRVHSLAQQLHLRTQAHWRAAATDHQRVATQWTGAVHGFAHAQREHLLRVALRLEAINPALVLQRGYAWLADSQGAALTRSTQLQPGQQVHATLSDGTVDLVVEAVRQN